MQQLEEHLVEGLLSTGVTNQLFSFKDNYSTKNNSTSQWQQFQVNFLFLELRLATNRLSIACFSLIFFSTNISYRSK